MISRFILPAFSFGLSAAVIPGPLIAYVVNTTLTQGWRRALLVVLAPLITDAPIIVLMTFLLGQMPDEILKLIQLGGGILFAGNRMGRAQSISVGYGDESGNGRRAFTGIQWAACAFNWHRDEFPKSGTLPFLG